MALYGFMTTWANFQLKNLPNQIFNQKLRTFCVRNSNGRNGGFEIRISKKKVLIHQQKMT